MAERVLPLDFQAVFELSPNPYMMLDRELCYVAANRAYLTVTASRLEDLLGRHIFDAFPNDADDPDNLPRAMVRESLERVLATGEADSLALIPYRVPRQTPDGIVLEVRNWSATHTPLLDADGEVRFILQHTVDVTEVEALRQAAAGAGVLARAEHVQQQNILLAKERGHLRRLFDQAPGFIAFLSGREHVFELANKAYLQLVGHREIVGKPVLEALPEITGQGFLELLDRVFSTGEPFVGEGVRVMIQQKPGAGLAEAFVDFVYQPIVDASGNVAGIFVQGNDITSQKRLEQERARLLLAEQLARGRAEEAERVQRFLAESIPQQIWTAAPDGRLDFVSDRVLDYFQASREQVLDQGWKEFIHPDDLPATVERWSRALQTGHEYYVEFRLRRADGQFRWHLGRALPRRDPQGRILKWFGTNTDIDEARKARDELRRRAEFEEQLIGIVSHDLRNPLQAVGMSASLLMRHGRLDDSQGKAVARIISSTERATRLIRDFLDFTQARSLGHIPVHPAWTNLREITRQVVDEVSLAHPDRIATVEHHGEETGRWDADRISQVIANLVANAFQHGPPDAPVRIVSSGDGEQAEISVYNEGPPIPPADLARLFEPFVRGSDAKAAPARSVGLGLYIARQIVAAHGGRIDVHSQAGRGTRFTVRLPRGAEDLARDASTGGAQA